MTEWVYAKDRFAAADAPVLTTHDRSFRFGDGIFETVLIHAGRMWDWSAHIARLSRGLEHFRLAFDTSALPDLADELIRRNGVGDGYLRIIVSRGENGPDAIGYKPGASKPYAVLQTVARPLPAFSRIRLHVSRIPVVWCVPCKTNSALHYAMALQEAAEAGCDNALLLTPGGIICETATANLCWIKGDTLFAPASDLPMVPGTVQQKVLALWQGVVKQGHYTLENVCDADEAFMTNVGGLITGISGIHDKAFAGSAKTEALRERLIEAL